VPWRIIEKAEDANAFASELEQAPKFSPSGRTSIFSVLAEANSLILNNQYVGTRLIIDISGNGPENSGHKPLRLKDRRITVNGLVFPARPSGADDPYRNYPYTTSDVVNYFRTSGAQGSGAFVFRIDTEADIERAILRKLLIEIAGILSRRAGEIP